jgi:hypothetical protein
MDFPKGRKRIGNGQRQSPGWENSIVYALTCELISEKKAINY